MVVGPAEPAVRRPDVGREPVVERVGVADSAADPLAYPPFAGEPVVVAVAVYGCLLYTSPHRGTTFAAHFPKKNR